VQHTLGTSYDYTSGGAGKYSFEASATRFQTDDAKILDVKIDAVEVEVTEAEETFGTATTTPTCDDQGQLSLLETILSEARALAGGAATDLANNPGSGSKTNYFGGNDAGEVGGLFDAIAGDLDSSGTRM